MHSTPDLPWPFQPAGGGVYLLERLASGEEIPLLTSILVILGNVLWILAYVCFVRIGFRQRTYALPLVAVCLNFSWEILFTLVWKPTLEPTLYLRIVWLLLDVVIFYQLLRFGRRTQQYLLVRRHYFFAVLGTFGLALLGLFLFERDLLLTQVFLDFSGSLLGLLINLVMSVLFVFLFLDRGLLGLSHAGAWLKMLGTGLIAIGNVVYYTALPEVVYQVFYHAEGSTGPLFEKPGPTAVTPELFYYLFAAIFVFDVAYIALITWARARAPKPGPDAAV